MLGLMGDKPNRRFSSCFQKQRQKNDGQKNKPWVYFNESEAG
jgi:hypothetical protein